MATTIPPPGTVPIPDAPARGSPPVAPPSEAADANDVDPGDRPNGDTSFEYKSPVLPGAPMRLGAAAAPAASNLTRAANTDKDLETLQASDPQGQRITDDIRSVLVWAVATPRSLADVGQAGILGRKQAVEAAKALTGMSPAASDAIREMLGRVAGDSDSASDVDGKTRQAVLLKEVAAQSTALTDEKHATRALEMLRDFAREIRGMSKQQVIASTTVIDIDNTVAPHPHTDPLAQTSHADMRTDDLGLFQRLTEACGPTDAQMVRAEADPIYAFRLVKDDLDNPDPTRTTAREEAKVLEAVRVVNRDTGELLPPDAADLGTLFEKHIVPRGELITQGTAVSRQGVLFWQDLKKALVDAQAKKLLTADQANLIVQYVAGSGLSLPQDKLSEALQILRGANKGSPTHHQIEIMRADRKTSSTGMLLEHALSDLASDATHIQYQRTVVDTVVDEKTKKPSMHLTSAQLTTVQTLLEDGIDVPFRVGDRLDDPLHGGGGHFMLWTDVRGTEPSRTFLVSDPWSGRTQWVKEADLTGVSGKWLRDQFHLNWVQVTHVYVPKSDAPTTK
jgi:hypothetical protein